MGVKLVVVAVLAVGAFLFFHGRGASAGKVAKCLQKEGATVNETRFLEESFFGGQDIPPEITKRLRKVEKGNYDVELGSDSGILMVVKSGSGAEEVESSLAAAGGTGIAQGHGRVVMYWYQVPSDSSAAALERCLD
jgi:hypothetical protein